MCTIKQNNIEKHKINI